MQINEEVLTSDSIPEAPAQAAAACCIHTYVYRGIYIYIDEEYGDVERWLVTRRQFHPMEWNRPRGKEILTRTRSTQTRPVTNRHSARLRTQLRLRERLLVLTHTTLLS